MSIGELAGAAGVSQRTVRYYEELGILPEPPRSPGGTRRYPPEFVFYLEGALVLKELGFRLDEIRLISQLARGVRLPKSDRAAAERAMRSLMEALDHRMKVLRFIEYAVLSVEPGDGRRLPSPEEFARSLGLGANG